MEQNPLLTSIYVLIIIIFSLFVTYKYKGLCNRRNNNNTNGGSNRQRGRRKQRSHKYKNNPSLEPGVGAITDISDPLIGGNLPGGGPGTSTVQQQTVKKCKKDRRSKKNDILATDLSTVAVDGGSVDERNSQS